MSQTEYPEVRGRLPEDAAGGSHIGICVGVWRNRDFNVDYGDVNGSPKLGIRIGDFSMSVTAEQWRALSDAVESVLPAEVVAS